MAINSNDLQHLLQEYPRLAEYVNNLSSDTLSKTKWEGDCLCIYIGLLDQYIHISKPSLEALNNYKKPNNISDFSYLENYGINYKTYYELALNITNSNLILSESGDRWKKKRLRFEVGGVKYEISSMSKLATLLTELIYSEFKFISYNDCVSMKIITDNDDYKNAFKKGLFYLNYYYLQHTSFHAELMLLSGRNDGYKDQEIYENRDNYENVMDYIFSEIKRDRSRKRADFINVEPLSLYLDSRYKKGENRFLSLYRILEFFMQRAIIKKIDDVRKNDNVSTEDILKISSNRNEEKQLSNLLQEVATESLRNRLCNYCISKQIIPSGSAYNKIHKELYQFRNSLVHAKETELNRAYIPDIFGNGSTVESWNYVVEMLAIRCIEKYNKK